MIATKITILEDVALIRSALGADIRRVALFGSYVRDPANARDVDILIEVTAENEQDVARRVSDLPFSMPVGGVNVKIYDEVWEEAKSDLTYHFVVCRVDGTLGFLSELTRRGGQYVFVEPVRDQTTVCT